MTATPTEVFLERSAPTSEQLHDLAESGYWLHLSIVYVEGQYCYRLEVYPLEGVR